MAAENADTRLNIFQSPFFGNQEWLKSIPNASPVTFYTAAWHEALGFAALCLQDQADYIKSLADCANPADALKCSGEYARKSWVRACGEGSKVFETLRTNVSSASQGK